MSAREPKWWVVDERIVLAEHHTKPEALLFRTVGLLPMQGQ